MNTSMLPISSQLFFLYESIGFIIHIFIFYLLYFIINKKEETSLSLSLFFISFPRNTYINYIHYYDQDANNIPRFFLLLFVAPLRKVILRNWSTSLPFALIITLNY